MGDGGPRRALIRQPVDAKADGEPMQFVDVVSQQVRPSQPLPAPDRIVHVERHLPPADTLRLAEGEHRKPLLRPAKAARLRWHCSVRGDQTGAAGLNGAPRAGEPLASTELYLPLAFWRRNLPQGTPLNPFRRGQIRLGHDLTRCISAACECACNSVERSCDAGGADGLAANWRCAGCGFPITPSVLARRRRMQKGSAPA